MKWFRGVLFCFLFLPVLVMGENGVWNYTNNSGKSFTYTNLSSTRVNDFEATKNIMLTYQNENFLQGDISIFNNHPEEDKSTYSDNLGTHYLYSPEDFHYTKNIDNTLKSIDSGEALGNRVPIILVHGWQGDNEQTNPKSQIEEVDSPEEYWHNLITFFTEHHDLKNKYKLYVYKYPSYKHVSFNGQILKNMLSPNNIITELKNKKIVFIAHSMGTIVTSIPKTN